jgi:hypothetical protein
MLCAKCKTENPDGLKFCNECGAAFKTPCASCGFQNVPAAKFCGQWGGALDGPKGTPIVPLAAVVQLDPEGERRHLTVLFCDVVDSTSISSALDPEEWRETLEGFHCAATEAISGWDGHVAKYLGDGEMAYFGWQEAHDNDAERAVRAGLALHVAIAQLNEQLAHTKLSDTATICRATWSVEHLIRSEAVGGCLRQKSNAPSRRHLYDA